MNRSKKLLSLLAVLIILIGVTVLITKLSVEEDVAGENSISIFTLDADNVTELSWTYGEETISVVCL